MFLLERDQMSQTLGIKIVQVSPGHAQLSMLVRADMVLSLIHISGRRFALTRAARLAKPSFTISISHGVTTVSKASGTKGTRSASAATMWNPARTGCGAVRLRKIAWSASRRGAMGNS